jgi:putative transcriptional regulator
MAIGVSDRDGAHSSLRGQLLIATPSIGDTRFARTVIFLCAHNNEHAMGLILNRRLGGLSLPDLIEQLGVKCSITVPDRPVRAGGPMEQDRGFVLHSDDFYLEDATVRVAGGVGLTATKEILEAIGSPGAPREAVLALGYAGWGPGQLESELKQNAWLLAPAREELVFSDALETAWEGALSSIGVNPAALSTQSGRA